MSSNSHYTHRSTSFRVFVTCWAIFVLHFATNFVREHYLVVSIVDDFSFRLDEYVDLHVDIFETPEHGAHHGANPGASMIAALPYLVFKPAVDAIVQWKTRHVEDPGTAVYQDDRPARTKYYRQVRERGLDVKFGLVGMITMVFCMAPLSALSAVVLFRLFALLGYPRSTSLAFCFLYAFGTPIFFRTHYLNQNLMVGLFALFSFVLLWQPGLLPRLRMHHRFAVAGLLSGVAVLCDYSGLIVLAAVGVYALFKATRVAPRARWLGLLGWFAVGCAGPILLLWFYQWRSFGHPFYPPQHHMPPVEWIDVGYQGVGGLSGELLSMLLFDPRFGLFTSAPILLLSLAAPFLILRGKSRIPVPEMLFMLGFSVSLVLFFSTVQYTRLQWVTGIRYVIPVVPFLFLLTAAVLARLPRMVAYLIGLVAVAQAWCMSMVTDDILQDGILNAISAVFLQGFQLPWLTTLQKMSAQYVPELMAKGVSPLPLFVLAAAFIYGLWRFRLPWEQEAGEEDLPAATPHAQASSDTNGMSFAPPAHPPHLEQTHGK